MRIALHACCGPCLLEPLDALAPGAEQVTIVYANPNIHPAEEYERRRDTLGAYAASIGATVVELPYDPERWVEAVGPHVGPDAERLDRCRACWRLRLEMTARWAVENGYDALATTLTVSPYQDALMLAEEAEAVAARFGLTYVGRDYRERYAAATSRSRELGMYRQNYCGCLLSEVEARGEREARRRERAARTAAAAAGGGSGADGSAGGG
jgi:predicted adenine nucleotide alpha hydrolase (AANH) superfamily ATPase